MIRIFLPAFAYIFASAIYLLKSGAPFRVQAVSLGVLAIGTLIPMYVSLKTRQNNYRIIICGSFALVSILIWDLVGHLVVLKMEPLLILKSSPWMYPTGALLLGSATFLMTYLSDRIGISRK